MPDARNIDNLYIKEVDQLVKFKVFVDGDASCLAVNFFSGML